MRKNGTLLVLVGEVLLGRSSMAAQTCRGSAALGGGAAKGIVGTAVVFNSAVASYSGLVGGGSDTVFGIGQIGVNHYDDLGIDTCGAGAIIGGQVAADAERRTVICPFGFVTNEFGNGSARASMSRTWPSAAPSAWASSWHQRPRYRSCRRCHSRSGGSGRASKRVAKKWCSPTRSGAWVSVWVGQAAGDARRPVRRAGREGGE
jgi:hypothetical protein